MTKLEQLIKLWQEMSDLTQPECAKSCKIPQSCCSPEYCEAAIEFAQENYNVTLPRTAHPRLPLMSPTGCTAAPHFRPSCTLHTCDIAAFGHKFNRQTHLADLEWTRKYFKLRDQIGALELEIGLKY
jgi:hypothetical protein